MISSLPFPFFLKELYQVKKKKKGKYTKREENGEHKGIASIVQ